MGFGGNFSMKTAGIICEYDPFHLGHARQLRLIRESLGPDTAIVCAMSGNYVQRGEPAMWDKFSRAQAAVLCGADVVLELPITAVLQSAEGFARGGVEVLTRFGGIEYLSFGAECGSGETLMALARKIDTPAFDIALRKGLDQGLPYAAARQLALEDTEGLLRHPNNILGLEYCRAILALQSELKPLAVQRTGSYHDNTPNQEALSATAVRQQFPDGLWQSMVPPQTSALLDGRPWYRMEFGARAMLSRLRSMTDAEWEACAHGSEGLWSKAMKAARSQPDLEAIAQAVKSKRYPMTRIRRLLLCAYLGITEADLKRPLPYARILAASDRGRTLIRQAKKLDQLPLINPGQTPDDRDYHALETRAADLYTLFSAPGFPCPCRTEQDARLIL